MNRLLKTSFVMLFLLSSTIVYANDTRLTHEYRGIMRSTQALGMGNAFYGMSNDKYAPFYNPAGLGYVEAWDVDLLAFTVGMNNHLITRSYDIFDELLGGTTNLEDPAYLEEKLKALSGEYLNFVPFTFFPAYTMKNFTIGIFATANVNALAYNVQVLPEIAIDLQADAGLSAGYAIQFFDDSLSIGVGLKGLYRMGVTKSYTAVELADIFLASNGLQDLLSEITKDGTGWAVLGSVGVMYTIPYKVLNPRIGVSFNDFGYQAFGSLLDKIDYTLNASLSIAPSVGIADMYLAVEFVDLLFNANEDKSILKRMNVGGQIGLWDILYTRAGIHQGYLSAGLGIHAKDYFEIEYAFYTEELGAFTGQHPDQRHVIEFNIGF